jgi:hypothetical protein
MGRRLQNTSWAAAFSIFFFFLGSIGRKKQKLFASWRFKVSSSYSNIVIWLQLCDGLQAR